MIAAAQAVDANFGAILPGLTETSGGEGRGLTCSIVPARSDVSRLLHPPKPVGRLDAQPGPRVSYGMNGVVLNCKDLAPMIDYLQVAVVVPCAARPCTYLYGLRPNVQAESCSLSLTVLTRGTTPSESSEPSKQTIRNFSGPHRRPLQGLRPSHTSCPLTGQPAGGAGGHAVRLSVDRHAARQGLRPHPGRQPLRQPFLLRRPEQPHAALRCAWPCTLQ